jgi:hypothetical protein
LVSFLAENLFCLHCWFQINLFLPAEQSVDGIMKFDLLKDPQSKARAGSITDHGVIETPIFMPVGTSFSKGVHQS